MRESVIRKAILIGCQGHEPNRLHGVKQDLKNVVSFLCSERGGAWYKNEIKILPNATKEQVIREVHSIDDNYSFIYFSGHGGTSSQNERMLALQDSLMQDTYLLNDNPRQLIIVDACRSFLPQGIFGIPETQDYFEHFDGTSYAREIFDLAIRNSPYGRIILHAAQPGQEKSDSINGGVFTLALLNLAVRNRGNLKYVTEHVRNIIKYFPEIAKQRPALKIPSIYEEGNLTVPFAIGVPDYSRFKKEISVQKLKPRENADSGERALATLGVGILLLWIASLFVSK